MSGYQTRSFTFTYYVKNQSIIPNTAITFVGTYEPGTEPTSGRTFETFTSQWINTYNQVFIGELHIGFTFNTSGKIIDPTSWIVYDVDHGTYLTPGQFIPNYGELLISQNAVGKVAPGAVRNFKAWFLFSTESLVAPSTPPLQIDLGNGFKVIHLLLVICIFFIIAGVALTVSRKDNYLWITACGVLLLIILIFTQWSTLF